MKTTLITGLLIACLSVTAFAKDDEKDAAKKQEMMKAWMEYSTPGEAHKLLKNMAGKWKYTSKWWEKKDGKPEESSGTATMKSILGGRFIQHDIKGKAMGQPFEGMGIMGYDNVKKKYETYWLDTMGTGIMRGEGKFDAEKKMLTEEGEHTCPASKDKSMEYRGEWTFVDKNTMTYAMYGEGMEGGDEFKNMEMTFKRVK
jgi:hypothetical protein